MSWRVGVGHFETTPDIRRNVQRVLDTGRLSYGPFSRRLERKFAELHGARYGVLSNSGTASLQIALQAMKELHNWKDGDEVIVPALTFVATVNVILHNRMTPVLVDVDRWTYNLDPTRLEEAVTDRTRCIIPVHLFGQPADMNGIYSTIPAGVRVIEDSCEAVLAKYRNGGMVGSLGDVGCFSFYVAHHLTAGVGGIAVTKDERLSVRMRSLANHGRDVSSGGDMDILPSDMVRRNRFVFSGVGHSARMTEFEAAVAMAQLKGLKDNVAYRQDVARVLTERLKPYTWDGMRGSDWQLQLPTISRGNSHSFMMYPIIYTGDKWELCEYLEDRGIETREMLPLTNQPVYRGLFRERDYPVAEYINKHGFYIGCHPGIKPVDVVYMGDVFEEFLNERG
jgi:perosamine synthetase